MDTPKLSHIAIAVPELRAAVEKFQKLGLKIKHAKK